MATNFNIDTLHSYIGFSIKHMMISNVKGNFNTFYGKVEFENNAFKSAEVTIKVDSIYTGESKREAHLLSEDFFDVANFPEITFNMTNYIADGEKEGDLQGDITIRGVTKSINLHVELNGAIENQGKKHLGFSISGKLNRKDFGLNWNGLIEAGGVMVGDEVKLIVEIEAIEV